MIRSLRHSLVAFAAGTAFLLALSGCKKESPEEPPSTKSDTTSHEFVWQTFSLGDGAGSGLNNVAIIDDSTALAVGEIDLQDSTGEWLNPPYNLAWWNGTSWRLDRTTAPGFGYGENFSVWAFSKDDLWVGSSVPEHWNGQRWTIYGGAAYPYRGVGYRIWATWGTDSKNVYCAMEGGNIMHFDGAIWQALATGTTLPMQDIFGGFNSATQQWEILAVASNRSALPQAMALKRIHQMTVTDLPTPALDSNFISVWFAPGRAYYMAGAGIYETQSLEPTPQWISVPREMTPFYTTAIRGNAWNDLFAVGSFGEVLHYNGSTWRSYRSQTALPVGNYEGVSVKGNLVIAVGTDGEKARVAIGRRL